MILWAACKRSLLIARKAWVQMDYYNLKKLSDMSISIRRFTSERSALSFFSSQLSLPSQTFIFTGLLSPKMRSVVYGISGALRIRNQEMQKSATLKTLPNLTLSNFSCICLTTTLIPSSTLSNLCTVISSGYSAHLRKLSFLMMVILRPKLMLLEDTPAAILTQRICSTKKATQSSSWN